MESANENLLFFYGSECPHCIKMEAHLDRLDKEEGIQVSRLEVWHNEENGKKLEELDTVSCGGVPFFINKNTGKTICGETQYEEILSWAKGE